MGEVEKFENLEFFGGPLDGLFLKIAEGAKWYKYPMPRPATIHLDHVDPPQKLLFQVYEREDRVWVDPETMKLVNRTEMVYRGEKK